MALEHHHLATEHKSTQASISIQQIHLRPSGLSRAGLELLTHPSMTVASNADANYDRRGIGAHRESSYNVCQRSGACKPDAFHCFVQVFVCAGGYESHESIALSTAVLVAGAMDLEGEGIYNSRLLLHDDQTMRTRRRFLRTVA